MPKTLYRSISKELFVALFLSIAFLNSVLMMEKLLRLSRLLSGVGATFSDILVIVFYIQPQLLILTVPMALLVSTLIVYGRMNMDSEIIALKASGMSFIQISVPVVMTGMLCFVFALAVSFSIAPYSSRTLRAEITRIMSVRSSFAIEEGTFHSAFKDITVLVKGKKASDSFESIFIYDSRNGDDPRVLTAREGRLSVSDDLSVSLDLKDGYISTVSGAATTEIFFERYRMAAQLDMESPGRRNIELTPSGLLREAESSPHFRKKASLYLEFHRRLTLPAVCLILSFLGPPLALLAGKSGRLGGLAIGLGVFTGYYIILLYGESLVKTGKLPHPVGGWLCFAVLGILTYWIFRRESRR